MERMLEYRIGKESMAEQIKAGRYNPSLEITFPVGKREVRHKLGAGCEDDIHVFRDGDLVFVLTTHHGLGYAGLEVFGEKTKLGDVFLSPSAFMQAFDDVEPSVEELLMMMQEYVGL